jgi:glycosyltransferase involved in cell wall biosynthesis
MRIAFVLWHGGTGGNQTLTADVVSALRRRDVDARIVFVGPATPVSTRLEANGVPYRTLGLDRGRQVVLHGRRLAQLVRQSGPDCAVLVSSGYLAGTLRIGGFRSPIVAVEHGTLLQLAQSRPLRRALRTVDRLSGLWACDAEVAVSEHVLSELTRRRHAPRVVCIPNAVDLGRFHPQQGSHTPAGFVVGCAARLVPGKGVEDAILALAAIRPALVARLRVAGDGPELTRLRALAATAGVADRVELLGRVEDMPAFWRSCHVAVVPSREWIESFSIAAVEAMACGLPVIASANGGLPEVVRDSETGTLVEPGDVAGLAAALELYAEDPDLRAAHGAGARAWCEDRFGLERCAADYAGLCADLVADRSARPS